MGTHESIAPETFIARPSVGRIVHYYDNDDEVAFAPVQRATGLVAFVGRCVFGVPGADDLRELFADRRKSGRRALVEAHLRPDGIHNPHSDMLLDELTPLNPTALGSHAGILWGRQLGRLLVSLSAGLAVFSKTCEGEEPGTPMLVHVDEILSLIPLDLQPEHFGPTFAIFAALARREYASTGFSSHAVLVVARKALAAVVKVTLSGPSLKPERSAVAL